jgi:hypothetical protein
VLFIILFYLFFILLVSGRCYYFRRCEPRKCSRPSRRRLWAAASRETRQVFLDHVDPICFLSLVTHLHVLIGLPIHYIPIGLGLWLVNLLSPVVMSVVQVFHLIWCWVWLVPLWECLVFPLSWCEVTMVRIDAVVWARFRMVETVGFRQLMWIIMLESTKDRSWE